MQIINTTQVPNELLEQIFMGEFSLQEIKILTFVVRKTIGWQKETDWLQNDYIAKSIGMDKAHVSRTVKKLIDKGLLEVFEQSGQRFIGLLLLPNQQPPVAKSATDELPNRQPLKETTNIKKLLLKEERSFSKPTVEEVKEYCDERKNKVDPQVFVDFYASKGWKVGNTPMKDWKACVRTWERRYAGQGFTQARKSENVLTTSHSATLIQHLKSKTQ